MALGGSRRHTKSLRSPKGGCGGLCRWQHTRGGRGRGCASATDDEGAQPSPELTKELSDWDIKGLKKEVSRQVLRQFKKVSKGDERIRKEEEKIEKLMALEDPPMDALEGVADVDQLKSDLADARSRLQELNQLEDGLQGVKSANNPAFAPLAELALSLGVDDKPPPKQPRGPKKQKQAPAAPRIPFIAYPSKDGIEIRVGRGSADNDKLSCDPAFRDGPDWWMHVAGHPGSHVVIRSHADDLPSSAPETIKDAAALAAKYSKGPQRGKVGVSLVRCRQVSKPSGAKAGLVRLNGDVETIKVDVKAEAERLQRLEANVAELNSTTGLSD